jgi:hypothetical protein
MKTVAVWMFSIGLAAQLVGGLGALVSSLRGRSYLREPRGREVDMGDGKRGWIISPHLNADAEVALRAVALPPWALMTLGLGIIANFLGSIFAL